jgi:hypothetical protein
MPQKENLFNNFFIKIEKLTLYGISSENKRTGNLQ